MVRDSGWTEYIALEKRKGIYETTTDYCGANLFILYSWDSSENNRGLKTEYLMIEQVFVGDHRAIFDITPFLENDEDLALKLEEDARFA